MPRAKELMDRVALREGPTALRDRAKRILSALLPRRLPLGLRQTLVIKAAKLRLPGHYWFPQELLKDFAEENPDAYHAFLWRHHLAYASSFEVDERFGARRRNPRRMFFADLLTCLGQAGIDAGEIDSVFEVGCSLGYLLQFMESDVFPNASILEGIDLDEHAVQVGRAHLHHTGSKVGVAHGDMRNLSKILAGKKYDVIICAGVLMYARESVALETVRTMLDHANKVVGIAGLAHPRTDNAQLRNSTVRSTDRGFIHNIDEMVSQSGGTILARKWQSELLDDEIVYFVFATPRTPATRTVSTPS